MLNQIKSLIERAIPRMSSAIVILTLAAFTSPPVSYTHLRAHET